MKGDKKKIEGIVIEEDHVKIGRWGSSDANRLTRPVMDALRAKIKRHKFLDVQVIMGEDRRLYLVAETKGR